MKSPDHAAMATTMTARIATTGNSANNPNCATTASSTQPPPPLPRFSLWQKLVLLLSKLFSIQTPVPILGLIHLVLRRKVLQGVNLIDVSPAVSNGKVEAQPFRLANGYGTDPKNPTTGVSGTPFGRNMPPASPLISSATVGTLRYSTDGPPPQQVAQVLLQRRRFKPAGNQFNIMGSAWIQFMSHDWMVRAGAVCACMLHDAHHSNLCMLPCCYYNT